VTASGVEAGAARVRSVWPRLARGGATGLLAVTVAFDEAAHAERAGRLVSFILSPEGQAILTRHGFAAPTGPGG
jgi:ABC-type Fe3+ transport system substrate-binding protein